MIATERLTASYDGVTKIFFPKWHLEQGQHSLMLGPSGSGKTTLLHILAGLRQPHSGQVTIAGQNIAQLSAATGDKFRGKNIGLIFQKPHLIDSLSIKDNMLMAQYFAGMRKDLERVEEVLDELYVGHKLNAKTYQLSQGEAQRVSIARALLNKPKVILADEPTSSLDDDNCAAVYDLLSEQAKKHNATLVISTHDKRLKDLVPLQIELKKTPKEH